MENRIVKILTKKKLKISFAESCTGGMLSSRLVGVSGSSVVFDESIVTYSNEAKEKYLNVSKSTLAKYGSVSEEVANEMARGIVKCSNANIGVSITGIAGPTGATIGKPVGLVFIGMFYKKDYVFKHIFKGSRQEVREQSTKAALRHILDLVE